MNPRVHHLNPNATPRANGRFVLYWMQSGQRTVDNYALEYAAWWSARLSTPLLVVFVLADDYPGATRSHYRFLLEGLADVRDGLAERRIPFAIVAGDPAVEIPKIARGAALVVTDGGYTRTENLWRKRIADAVETPMDRVESNVVVPAGVASDHLEASAATIRRKIHRNLDAFLIPPKRTEPARSAPSTRAALATGTPVGGGTFDETSALRDLGVTPIRVPLPETAPILGRVDARVGGGKAWAGGTGTRTAGEPPHVGEPLHGGEKAARRVLKRFLAEGLPRYLDDRNDPANEGAQSNLSPYLHFGQISPVTIALATLDAVAEGDDAEARRVRSEAPAQVIGGTRLADHTPMQAFLEQLIVRRELAINHVVYNDAYDRFEGLPDWARTSLLLHRTDPRPVTYTEEQLAGAETHDRYWNAAQTQMVRTGSMHGYMRMYWGKKIIEWTADPREAFAAAIALNDRYELDGRDPNGYAGVAWCFGRHDRGWTERPIFGKVRYMNAAGLERKFDIGTYAARWAG